MTQPQMVAASLMYEGNHDVYYHRASMAHGMAIDASPKREPMRPVGIRKMPASRVSRKRYSGKWS